MCEEGGAYPPLLVSTSLEMLGLWLLLDTYIKFKGCVGGWARQPVGVVWDQVVSGCATSMGRSALC
jgi:hypothetical protein